MTPPNPAPVPVPGADTATLVRIRLDRRTPQVRRDLADPTSLHRTVMRLAPRDLGDSPREKAGLLFRLEATPGTPPVLLLQTHHPDLTNLPPGYGTIQTCSMAPMLAALTPGRRVHYSITAAPLIRRKVPGTGRAHNNKDRHRPVPLHGDDALAWWENKAALAGLGLHHTTLTPLPSARRRPDRRPPAPDTAPRHTPHSFDFTRFDGEATVTDPGLLHHALLTGIGRCKPYGAGLLSLLPARPAT